MSEFELHLPTRIVFGPNKVDALGHMAREFGAHRALVVSDRGIVAAGHTPRGIHSLESAGVETLLFDAVEENPTTDTVESGTRLARDFRPDLLIGIGGGSSMDAAKGINFLHSCGGRMQDYWGVGKATSALLPMIAVPTTAGTGSEAQSFALISDSKTHVKMACGDKRAACRVALLDPTLTVTQPRRVTALTGLDAIAHALESFVTRRRNPASILFSREAWRLLERYFSRVLEHPHDLEARGGMQVGACYAGVAIEQSMLGAAHALANPLTSHYGIVHGHAIGLMLPHVIRFNGHEHDAWYRELLSAVSGHNGAPSPDAGANGLADYVAHLAAKTGLPTTLAEAGVDDARLPNLASDAAKQWTGTFNPRHVGERELLELYQAAF